MGARSPLGLILACLTFALCLGASPSEAQTRRAFLVGVQRYADGYINPLTRAVNDAKDVGKDLDGVMDSIRQSLTGRERSRFNIMRATK